MKRLALSSILLSACIIATAAAQEVSAPRIYDMSEVCAPGTRAARVYPVRALERGAIGEGVIDCVLDATSRPQTCQVVEESSPGWGWGEAGLRASCIMSPHNWANPAGADARNYTDENGVEHARRTMRFRIESGWRPEDVAQGSERN